MSQEPAKKKTMSSTSPVSDCESTKVMATMLRTTTSTVKDEMGGGVTVARHNTVAAQQSGGGVTTRASGTSHAPTAMREWDRAWMDAEVGSVLWYTDLSRIDAKIITTDARMPTKLMMIV